MKYHIKILVCTVLFFSFAGNFAFSQSDEQEVGEKQKKADDPKIYFGVGMGLDYGGILGIKAEYLPIKHLGIFGGVGLNLMPVGWNAGLTFKMLPDKRVSPNLMAFYGYNAIVKIINASQYDMTSYGVSFGVNVDVKIRRSKLSFGIYLPIRSSKFQAHYSELLSNPNIEFKHKLLPVAWGIGFNFGI